MIDMEEYSYEFSCPSKQGISRQLLEVPRENGALYELWWPDHVEETWLDTQGNKSLV